MFASAFRRVSELRDAIDLGAAPARSPGCDRDAEEYNMCHPRRGVALIFNHQKFDRLPFRSGAIKDCENLSIQLKNLGFDVQVHKDLTYMELSAVLRDSTCDEMRSSCRQNFCLVCGSPRLKSRSGTSHLH
jgi:hypothetical protein